MTNIAIGKGLTVDVDFTKFNQSVLDHILYIGARNILMDSHANVTRESAGDDIGAQSLAVATKKLQALYDGDLRTTSTREGDPIKAEATRLALNALTANIKKAGKKVKDYDPKALREKAREISGKYLEQAAKNVADAKAAEIDIEGLALAE